MAIRIDEFPENIVKHVVPRARPDDEADIYTAVGLKRGPARPHTAQPRDVEVEKFSGDALWRTESSGGTVVIGQSAQAPLGFAGPLDALTKPGIRGEPFVMPARGRESEAVWQSSGDLCQVPELGDQMAQDVGGTRDLGKDGRSDSALIKGFGAFVGATANILNIVGRNVRHDGRTRTWKIWLCFFFNRCKYCPIKKGTKQYTVGQRLAPYSNNML